MKTIPYRLLALLIGLGVLSSCLRTIELPVLGDASGTVIRVGKPVLSGNKQTFTIDVHVVDASGNYVNALGKDNFSIKDTTTNPYGITYSLIDVKAGNKTAYKGDYSAFLLLDQSGSTNTTDYENLRIKASQIFLDALGKNDKVALASFTDSDDYYYPYATSYTHLHGGFTNNGASLYPSLDSLVDIIPKAGTPLYSSILWSLKYTSDNAPSTNKALIVFTDGQSGDWNLKAEAEKLSLSKNIPVFTVGLSNGVNVSELNDLALNTGGSFMWAKDAKQLISYFGTLGNLLRGNADFYTLTFEATSKNSFPTYGNILYLQVKLPNGKKFLLPYVIKFE
jgi:hypothetical protein